MTSDAAALRGDGRSDAPQVFQGRALGSKLRLTLQNLPPVAAEAAWQAVLDEFGAVDRAMSNYREDSGISELNGRAGEPEPLTVERRLYTAISLADRAWRMTDGRFDGRVLAALQQLQRPGIQPVEVTPVDRWPVPSGIIRDPCDMGIAIQAPLDLGGVGKGLALRWAWDRLSPALDQPGRGALIEAGGDLVGRGPGPDGDAWLIGIDDPDGGEEPVAVVALESGGLCTSSIEISRWPGPSGEPAHHLIDPKTGLPGGHGLKSVTVAAPDPAWAEIWSKTLFLAGPGSIGPEARSLGLTAWWIVDDGTLEMTPAARQRMRWP
jgi:FAD:protein FMN transferase